MAERDVDAVGRLEAEFLFEDAEDHDAGGHDRRLRVFRRGEGGVGAVGDDARERFLEDAVHFFEEGFAGAGESGEPGRGHADSLDALA